ncbi:translation initiation factor 2 [Pseudovibrio sp. Alg231-02]|jgi:predicted small secreted protein|uniref:translation initiation factor 2 n=1 Tax=Pseudovibrio sp. Alg231-02 TaxID=1922223 RepID=UPI000D55B386|nr:translation initiation factor 2 [Pseudovibrio sp. Alg231-02]
MKSYFVAGVVASSILLAGCGTVVRGTSEDIKIDVKPANAKITSTTAHTCVGPCVINVPRKKEFTLTASAPGYQSQVIDVQTRVSGKGAAGMAGNIILGGVIGVGVDAATGATLDHYPNPVTFNLKRGKGSRKLTPAEIKLMNKAKTPTS